ncbi:MAG: hypothetical protein Q9164_004647, partial [Protoblastenia rupestris]
MFDDTTNPPLPDPTFHKAKHIKYWLRCLKTVLPTAYTSNDSQRMTFAFFTISALDILDALDDHTTAEERQGYADWIYRCQHPGGGFRGFTGADGGEEMSEEGKCWDPANLAATFFALAALMVLGDGMENVKRSECLEWARTLQRGDGSFGEAIGKNGVIEGGGDTRYCYLAAGVRWILRRGELEEVQDIRVEELGGYVERLPPPGREEKDDDLPQNLIRWLVSRQTLYLQEEDDLPMAAEDVPEPAPEEKPPSFQVQNAFPVSAIDTAKGPNISMDVQMDDLKCAGFNGRCNKVADTCYAFWVGGSLGALRKTHLQDFNAIRRYLLEKTQHIIGGFGKMCGDPP